MVAVGSNIALGVDNLAERLAELDELLFGALPWEVPEVEHLRRGLRVPKLRRPRGRHSAEIGWPIFGIGG